MSLPGCGNSPELKLAFATLPLLSPQPAAERVSVVDSSSKLDSRELAEFLTKEGQLLLPLLDLVTQGQRAIDEVIDVMGRATIEAILKMSAEEVAGKRQQGKASDRPHYWHGTQPGRVALAERQLRVDKPRLRKRQSVPGAQA